MINIKNIDKIKLIIRAVDIPKGETFTGKIGKQEGLFYKPDGSTIVQLDSVGSSWDLNFLDIINDYVPVDIEITILKK
jgi:hypothetical protein